MNISRDDLEAKARQLVGSVEETKESAKETTMIAAVLAAFYFGRRRGKRNKSVVEVYRV